MMKTIWKTIQSLPKRARFVQGLAVGLASASFFAYAAVSLTTFTSGTTISSTDVNANFQALKAEFERIKGDHLGISTDFTFTCLASYPSLLAEFTPVPFDVVLAGNNFVGTTYTANETGMHAIYSTLETTTDYPVTRLSLNGALSGLNILTGSAINTIYLNTGDTLQLVIGCETKHGSSLSLDNTKTSLVIKPL